MEKSRRAWEYRLEGESLRVIGAKLKMTVEGVRKALLRFYDIDDDDELRFRAKIAKLEGLDRLDRLTAAWLGRALEGDYGAAIIILKIAERRAKYFKLDGQEPVADADRIGLPLEFVDQLREIAEGKMPSVNGRPMKRITKGET